MQMDKKSLKQIGDLIDQKLEEKLEQKFEQFEKRLEAKFEPRFAHIEQKLDGVYDQCAVLTVGLYEMNGKIEKMDEKLEEMDEKLEDTSVRVKRMERFLPDFRADVYTLEKRVKRLEDNAAF